VEGLRPARQVIGRAKGQRAAGSKQSPQTARAGGRTGGKRWEKTTSKTATGHTRESPTPGHSTHCPHRSKTRAQSPIRTYDDEHDLAAYCTSTDMRPELHG